MGNTDEEGHAFVSEIIGLDQDAVWVSHEYEDDDYAYSDTFPLLRPLSDLTKEIEHNGKKFIPLHIINGFGQNSESICDRWIEPNLTTQGGGSWEGGIEDDIDTFQFYWLYVKLISWHFDVFGLIEKGLAIDINSIEGKNTK
ncbi:hypothetical protein [Sphingobacterium multivorum]|uniref:hypothetical protein n=1 Tax=Sphingobacterium multivorum TaxID=28454 RepID=UPI0028A9B46B|nr:hypothetical protein [Sphingobacterium multivorum]